jgi:hypothetical protein
MHDPEACTLIGSLLDISAHSVMASGRCSLFLASGIDGIQDYILEFQIEYLLEHILYLKKYKSDSKLEIATLLELI